MAGTQRKRGSSAGFAQWAVVALAAGWLLACPGRAIAGPPSPLTNADANLTVPPSVVAWGGIASWNSLFDVVATAGPQLGLLSPEEGPPGVKLWAQAEEAAKGFGIVTLAWLRRDQPIRCFFQDEGGTPSPANLVILLPITSQAEVHAALTAARLGEDGHAAVVAAQDSPTALYIDFLPGHAALTFETTRWSRAAAIATGPVAAAPLPGLVSVGISAANLAALRPAELRRLREGIDHPKQLPKQLQASAGSYAATVKQLVEELDTFELVLGGDKESLQLGFRLRGRPGTALFRSLHAGDGRSVADLVRLLPGASYLAAVSHVDPAPALASAAANFAVLESAIQLPKRQKAALLSQYTALMRGLTGQLAMGLYPDGDAVLGGLAVVGAKEPLVFRLAAARFAGQLGLALMDSQAKSAAADRGKPGKRRAKDPAEAQVEAAARKGLAQGSLRPLIQALQPKAAQAGVALIQTESNVAGLACDAVGVSIDWAKLNQDSIAPNPMGPALLGKGLTLAACSTAQWVILAMGPNALAQARRVADGGAGGLADQPGYRAALAHAVPNTGRA